MGTRSVRIALLVLALLLAGCTDDANNDADADDQAEQTTSTPTPDDGPETPEPDPADDTPTGTDPLPALPDDIALPIVFVHGFAGSAQQYESQAMRLVANGYPADRIVAYDHDGAGFDLEGYAEGLAEVVDATLADTGFDQIYLVGHSRGTPVSLSFLTQEGRVDQVAKLILIDGVPCPEPEIIPVPCLAPNQEMFPGQAHVEVATSPESFAAQFEFLVGTPPEVVDIVAQRAPVVLEGRAVDFPSNVGRQVTLAIWEVDPATGHRVTDEPHATFALGADGAFGPVEVKTGVPYEFELYDDSGSSHHHVYLQPYLRSSHLVRLLSSSSEGATRVNTNAGDDHAALVVMRMREWYATGRGEDIGASRDSLLVQTRTADGSTTDEVDVLAEFVGNGGIGLHLHDDADNAGVTTLAPLPYFSEQPFQSGVDVFLPASPDADGTITLTNIPRGDSGRTQTINVPNWPSSGHSISVLFADYPLPAFSD